MSSPSSRTSAYSVLTLGLTLSRSIWEIRLAETPMRLATSRRLRPICSRRSRSRGPMCEGSIDAEHLVLSSDCGFGRQGVPRPIAYYKAAAMVQAANIVRGELGAEQTEPRASDPELQIDVPEGAAVTS